MNEKEKQSLKEKYANKRVSYLIGRINGITEGIRTLGFSPQRVSWLTEEIDVIAQIIFEKTCLLD
jgi:hypothetical protein